MSNVKHYLFSLKNEQYRKPDDTLQLKLTLHSAERRLILIDCLMIMLNFKCFFLTIKPVFHRLVSFVYFLCSVIFIAVIFIYSSSDQHQCLCWRLFFFHILCCEKLSCSKQSARNKVYS